MTHSIFDFHTVIGRYRLYSCSHAISITTISDTVQKRYRIFSENKDAQQCDIFSIR